MTIAYVVTSKGNDVFADMALVSALSARLTNASAKIVLLCDHFTANGLRDASHRVLDACDDIVRVETPAGESTFRNRWIKTKTIDYVPGPCLVLDTDTLIRGSLKELSVLATEVGVVANHNSQISREQLYPEDIVELEKLGWPEPESFKPYANGGFLFYHSSPTVEAWFKLYHRLWLEGYHRTGRPRDQPALNTSLKLSGTKFIELPAKYNLQINVAKEGVGEALVWHFYSSTPGIGRIYRDLLTIAATSSLDKLRTAIEVALMQQDPQRPLWLAQWIYSLSRAVSWQGLP